MTDTDRDDALRDFAALTARAIAHGDIAYDAELGAAADRLGGDCGVSAAAIEARMRELLGLPAGNASPSLADRVTEILADAGYTDARLVFPGGFLVTEGPGYATTGSVVVSVPWADGTDAERRRLLLRFAEALREGGLWVTAWPHYLDVRTMPGEGAK